MPRPTDLETSCERAPRSRPTTACGPEYEHVYSGKVRDLYRTPDDRLLFVASDRISAYDWVLPTPIPDKGRILTALSQVVVQAARGRRAEPRRVRDDPARPSPAGPWSASGSRCCPIECVVRGYLAGSGLTDYLRDAARSAASACRRA